MTKRTRLIGAVVLAVGVWAYIVGSYCVNTYEEQTQKNIYMYNLSASSLDYS